MSKREATEQILKALNIMMDVVNRWQEDGEQKHLLSRAETILGKLYDLLMKVESEVR